jgi:protease-4
MFKRLLAKLPVERMAVVPLSGPIFSRTIEQYAGLFQGLERSGNIKGVMLEIESPGGSAVASEYLYDRLKRLNEKKPLYCYALMAASGGYMAAAAARKIYAPSTGLVGSIGVLSIKPVVRGLMERAGISLEVMKKGAMKDMTLFHRESTEEERRVLESLQEDIYERFIEMVSTARSMPREKVRELATGELFSGRRAGTLGLIDGVRDYQDALEELSRETGVSPLKTMTLRPRKRLLKRVMTEAAGALADELWWRGL